MRHKLQSTREANFLLNKTNACLKKSKKRGKSRGIKGNVNLPVKGKAAVLFCKPSTDTLIQLEGLKKAIVRNTETEKMMSDPSRAEDTQARKSLSSRKTEETREFGISIWRRKEVTQTTNNDVERTTGRESLRETLWSTTK